MKKLLAFILIIVSLLSLASCSQSGRGHERGGDELVKSYNDTEWLNDGDLMNHIGKIEADYHLIRAGTANENTEYPSVRIMRSVQDVSNYLDENPHLKDNLFDFRGTYNEAYFTDRILIIVLLEEGSGSISHQINSIGLAKSEMLIDIGTTDVEVEPLEGSEIVIDIDRIVPEVGTCDIAYWHVLIEPESGFNRPDSD